jgi:hypothetical protein
MSRHVTCAYRLTLSNAACLPACLSNSLNDVCNYHYQSLHIKALDVSAIHDVCYASSFFKMNGKPCNLHTLTGKFL